MKDDRLENPELLELPSTAQDHLMTSKTETHSDFVLCLKPHSSDQESRSRDKRKTRNPTIVNLIKRGNNNNINSNGNLERLT